MTTSRPLITRGYLVAAPLIAITLVSPAVHADEWALVGELPAAVAISAPQKDRFEPGIMPTIGVLRGLSSWLMLGARLRGGALGDGPAPGGDLADPGMGGLITMTLAARVAPSDRRGPWLELGVGGGFTGDDQIPVVEAGIGWSWGDRFAFGPTVRFVQVVSPSDDVMGMGDASLVTLGFEVRVGTRRSTPRIAEVVAVAPPPVVVAPPEPEPVDVCTTNPTGPGCPGADRDGDGIIDSNDACPDQPEVVNGVDDGDGCPDEGLFTVIDDRIVLEEAVFFEVNRARVKRKARPVVEAIVAAWNAHPEWTRLVVEGHADVRGSATFNQWLSGTRGDRVRAALVNAGLAADRIDAVGHGASRPRDPGHTEAAHARNRRVEFVIIRGTPRDGAPVVPAPATTGGAP